MDHENSVQQLDNLTPYIASPTPLLKALVPHYKSTLSPEVFDSVLRDIKSHFNRFTDELLQVPSGPPRADHLHRMMDHELKATAALEVSCKKGCSGCCHYEVEITKDEGELLALAVGHGFAVDMDRLAVQAARERKSAEWLKFWNPQNRCVFLGADGACQIYEYRPSICRKHSVVTPASACTTVGAEVTPVQVPLAEVLLSAALSIPDTPRSSLSKMLFDVLEISQTPVVDLSSPEPLSPILAADSDCGAARTGCRALVLNSSQAILRNSWKL
jgi:uncharacterized protein